MKNNINYTFFDTFKELEQLLNKRFECQNGVTTYINKMEQAPLKHTATINNWSNDLKNLKQYRHKRNQLSHETGAFETTCATQEDVDGLKRMIGRLQRHSDPLTRLEKRQSEVSQRLMGFGLAFVALVVIIGLLFLLFS